MTGFLTRNVPYFIMTSAFTLMMYFSNQSAKHRDEAHQQRYEKIEYWHKDLKEDMREVKVRIEDKPSYREYEEVVKRVERLEQKVN